MSPAARTRTITPGEASSTADNIALRNTSSQQRRTANSARLDGLSLGFDTFCEGLQEDVTTEYVGQEDRLVGVARRMQKIQYSLVEEQTRRVDMLQTVECSLQEQCDILMSGMQAQLEALKPDIPLRIVSWHDRLDIQDQALIDERQRREVAIERERVKLLKTLEDFDARLAIEKVERLEREAHTLKQIVDENFGTGSQVDDERSRREATLGHLRDETDVIDTVRDKSGGIFKEKMMARMVRCTKGIKVETSRRVAAERQFVEALESYTTALKGGLRMVNKKAPSP